jgi:glycosyltransferase involved in cell wall biosynthesis
VRILIVTPTLAIGGSERLVVTYAMGLRDRGHQVSVAFGVRGSHVPRLRREGIPTHLLSPRYLTPRTLPEWTRTLRGVIRGERPDVVHLQSITAALAAVLAAPAVPRLVTFHGIGEANARIAPLAMRLAGARVTAVSTAAAEVIGAGPFAPPVELLRSGVDVAGIEEAARQPVELEPASPRVVCVARHLPSKGVDVLVRAFPGVLEERPGARLVLVGYGDQSDRLVALAKGLGIGDQTHFVGLVGNAAPYLAAADVVVLPSRREGLPVTLLEALALRRAVVASAVGGTPTIIHEGETGWLVPPEDEPALARAVLEAAADPAEAARRGGAGRELVQAEFGLDAMLDRLEELLLQTARRSRNASR